MRGEKAPILGVEYNKEGAYFELVNLTNNEPLARFISEESVYVFYAAMNVSKESAFAAGRSGI